MNLTLTLQPVDGLWVLTQVDQPPVSDPEPYEQVLVELAGAVAEWPLAAAAGTWPTLTLTEIGEADWLWRWIGPEAHLAVLTALEDRAPTELAVEIDHEAIAQVQRLGYGHWLRQWWPTSPARDIPALDPVLLALELAVLTVRCDPWLGDGYDSEAAPLLAGTSPQDVARAVQTMPAARGFVDELTDELVPHWSDEDLAAVRAGTLTATPKRDDFALAAGSAAPERLTSAVARGRCSIDWAAVPAGVFDTAEGSIHWSVDATSTVTVRVTTQLLSGADPSGLQIWFHLPQKFDLVERLDRTGTVETELPIEPADAWAWSWSDFRIGVGPRREGDHAAARDRVRGFVRTRLGGDVAFLAEESAATEQW